MLNGAELDFFVADSFGPVAKIIIELHPDIYGVEGVVSFLAAYGTLVAFGLVQKQKCDLLFYQNCIT